MNAYGFILRSTGPESFQAMEDDNHLIIKRSIFKETFKKSSLGRNHKRGFWVGCNCEATDCSGIWTPEIPKEGQNERVGGKKNWVHRCFAPHFQGDSMNGRAGIHGITIK
jgi:hypothetical protein